MTNYSVLEAVESQIRRIKVFYPGKKLSQCDCDLFHDVLLLEYHLLEDLLLFNETSLRQFRGFLGTSEIDIIKYAQTFKFADSYLKNSLSRVGLNDEQSLQSFKRSVKDAHLYWGLLKPLEEEFARFFSSYEPSTFQKLSTWVNFPSKVNFRSLDLSFQQQADYCQFETEMGCWEYEDDLVQQLGGIMSEWLKDFSLERFVPKHGPGSVAGYDGRLPVLYKHQVHEMDQRLRYFYQKDAIRPLNEYFPSEHFLPLHRVSELLFVPKTMVKNRTISKEPVSLQYTQQGVQIALYEYFRKHAYLSSRINLDKQELSKEAARRGSVHGNLDTLDLSNASDSVSLLLVKKVFAHTPLYRALICTRSDATRLPNGLVFYLNKFAPMGSSLCFPVETLIFAGICEIALRKCRHRSYYRVYGDDIVCGCDLTEDIKDILVRLNFQLNTEKSFFTKGIHNFREACGGEYLDGVEVTPLRISRKFVSYDDKDSRKVTSAETVQSYISFANNAFERGLYSVRRCILRLLGARYPEFRNLLFANNPAHLNTFDDCLTNWKLDSRFRVSSTTRDGNYQRIEFKCVSVVNRLDRRALADLRTRPEMNVVEEDDIRYFEYWRSRLNCDVYKGIQRNGLIVKPRAFRNGRLELCKDADIFAFLPEPIEIRPSRAVMHWKWVYLRD